MSRLKPTFAGGAPGVRRGAWGAEAAFRAAGVPFGGGAALPASEGRPTSVSSSSAAPPERPRREPRTRLKEPFTPHPFPDPDDRR